MLTGLPGSKQSGLIVRVWLILTLGRVPKGGQFKTGGNQYAVGPGSVRPDGVVYEVIRGNLSSPKDLPVFQDQSPTKLRSSGKIPVGMRNSSLWRRAVEYAPCCDSEDEIFENFLAYRDLEFDDPTGVLDGEVRRVAAWVWTLRRENRLWQGRDSEMKISRTAIDRLSRIEHGADAWLLYGILVDNHGHIPGKKFAIVPDAMIGNGMMSLSRGRAYRAIKLLLDANLLRLVRKGKLKEPHQYQLLRPVSGYQSLKAEGERFLYYIDAQYGTRGTA